MIESTQRGNIEITASKVGVPGNFLPVMDVYDFPFIFPDAQAAYSVFDGEVGMCLLDGL